MHPTRHVFTQKMHSCGFSLKGEATLDIRVMDAGVGPYLVLWATEWAIDSADDIAALCRVLTEMLAQCQQTTPDNPGCNSGAGD